MSLDVQLALITTIPPTLSALAVLWAVIHQDARSNKKLDHITVLTNSTLLQATNRIKELQDQIINLKAILQTYENPLPPPHH